jgi:hypothetical protein
MMKRRDFNHELLKSEAEMLEELQQAVGEGAPVSPQFTSFAR